MNGKFSLVLTILLSFALALSGCAELDSLNLPHPAPENGDWSFTPGRGDWTIFDKTNSPLASNYVTSIAEDSEGNIWFGTYKGGACRFDGTNWETFDREDGLADNNVRGITPDNEGKLWFATDAGVSSFDGTHWFTFTTQDGLAGNVTSTLFKDNEGNIWVSTNSGPRNTLAPIYYGVSRFDGTGWRTFDQENTLGGLPDDYVASINQDSQGNLWFGTGLGVCRYDGRNWETYAVKKGTPDYISAIEVDCRGDVWLGTLCSGVCRFNGEEWRIFNTLDGLAGNVVTSILGDSFGNVWFGTGRGVSRFDGEEWRTFTRRDGLADEQTSCIYEDAHGFVWFGTYTNGISRYTP